ncbi:MAG: membrane protein insertase YidC [Candidatus Omnitrophica bacterium]|nr:membrane protein insertase YidC [Candidatus Omnitrophota bacterium]
MEKRLFLAIALSFLVLYVWSALRPKSHSDQVYNQINNPQNIQLPAEEELQQKDSSGFDYSQTIDKNIDVTDNTQQKTEKETFTHVATPKLNLYFTNTGGNLKTAEIVQYNKTLPISIYGGIEGFNDFDFKLDRLDNYLVSYVYENDELRITKNYRVSEDDYLVTLDVILENKTKMSKQKDIWLNSVKLDIPPHHAKNSVEARDQSLYEYFVITNKEQVRKSKAHKFSDKNNKKESAVVDLIGYRDRYFSVIYKPSQETQAYHIRPIDEDTLSLDISPQEINIPAGGSESLTATFFIGPENLKILNEYNMGFDKVKKFYRFPLFDVIAMLIYYLLHLIHKVIPQWGICILIISAIIYFSMYPLTLRGMTSMKKMQSLQPKVLALRDKYKDNPQKLNKEMMELYRENKINPFGGCLPFLFQMPVFIGLYQVLWRDVSFKGAEFLWIKDLTEPDRLFTFGFNIPFIGNEFNILPVVMIVIMFFQQKLTAKNMVIADPDQAAQQKMMQRIFPVLLGVIFYKFASGLTLYFTMFYIYSTFTQWKISKETAK